MIPLCTAETSKNRGYGQRQPALNPVHVAADPHHPPPYNVSTETRRRPGAGEKFSIPLFESRDSGQDGFRSIQSIGEQRPVDRRRIRQNIGAERRLLTDVMVRRVLVAVLPERGKRWRVLHKHICCRPNRLTSSRCITMRTTTRRERRLLFGFPAGISAAMRWNILGSSTEMKTCRSTVGP